MQTDCDARADLWVDSLLVFVHAGTVYANQLSSSRWAAHVSLLPGHSYWDIHCCFVQSHPGILLSDADVAVVLTGKLGVC